MKRRQTCKLGESSPASMAVFLDVLHKFLILFGSPWSFLESRLITTMRFSHSVSYRSVKLGLASSGFLFIHKWNFRDQIWWHTLNKAQNLQKKACDVNVAGCCYIFLREVDPCTQEDSFVIVCMASFTTESSLINYDIDLKHFKKGKKSKPYLTF